MALQRPESTPDAQSLRLPVRSGSKKHWRPMNRILVNILLDGMLAAVAAPVARWLADPRGGLLHPLWFIVGGAVTLLVSGVPFRLPLQYWRFSGVADLIRIAAASCASAAVFALILIMTGFNLPTPTFPLIHALVLLMMMGGVRIIYRLIAQRPRAAPDARIILVGADEAADLFMRAAAGDRMRPVKVIGLLGQGSHQAGRRIQNVPILGHVNDTKSILSRLVRAENLPTALVITDADLRGERLAELLAAAEAHGVPVSRTPNLTALQPAERIELRPIAIEELLNRPPVPLDRDGMAQMINGRCVLVTGAGGSIGSELVRQIAQFKPSRLILLDHSEFALWQIDLELSEIAQDVAREVVLADVRDNGRIDAVMRNHHPELVFHAAALKHVPMVETNPTEGLLTNIEGTRIVADSAAAHGARAMVVISTDKAVNPSSLMGASKRAAEMYCQALDMQARSSGSPNAMRCVTVRFGNVLGSTGSVVPLFRRQLEQGGPLTVTHPEMRRYFMTVPEAVGLVLQASVRGTRHLTDIHNAALSAETDLKLREGGIFVLDMGNPVRIVDLARQMIRLAGLRPDVDIPIRFTGVRPGEKLYEELFHGREAPAPSDNAGLLIATPRTVDRAAVCNALDEIAAMCRQEREADAIAQLKGLVPEFIHNPTGAAGPIAPVLPHSEKETS